MTVTTHQRTLSTYTQLTASMQTDAAAHHLPPGDAAVVSSPQKAFPISAARCATFPSQMEWVPDREHPVPPVPGPPGLPGVGPGRGRAGLLGSDHNQ